MKASAIRIDVKELVKLESAVPEVVIATATIKFLLKGNLTFFNDEGMSKKMKEELLGKMLFKALQEVKL